MTKEEIYQQSTLKNLSNSTGTRMDIIYHAMGEYARHQVIGLLLFIKKNNLFVNGVGEWETDDLSDDNYFTSEQLYQKFIEESS